MNHNCENALQISGSLVVKSDATDHGLGALESDKICPEFFISACNSERRRKRDLL